MRERAKATFGHDFRTLWENAGLEWSTDNQAEIDDAVDAIYDDALHRAADYAEGLHRSE